MRQTHLFLFLLLLLLGSCDSAGVGGQPDGPDEVADTLRLTTFESTRIESEDLLVRVWRTGSISGIEWKASFVPGASSKWPVLGGGLWLAVDQNGPKSNVSGLPGPNYFEFLPTNSDTPGYIVVTSDSLQKDIVNWPSAAPTNSDGTPKMYGDRMAWAAFQPGEPASTMISGIQLRESVFVYDSGPLSEVAFQRIEIANISNEAIADLYIGVGGEIDVNSGGSDLGEPCKSLDNHSNQSGYDVSGQFAYTYISPFPEDGGLPDNCYGDVYAFAILPMTTSTGIGSDKLASRIVRRGGAISDLYPDYSEDHFDSPEVMLRALQGLSYLGDPMIDPTTNSSTKFAFTGDPAQGSGWLDERHDVRSLMSLQPITLPAGESVSITVAWFFASGNTLEDGMARIRARYTLILSDRESWDF